MNQVKNPIYIVDWYPERTAPKDPTTEKAEPVTDRVMDGAKAIDIEDIIVIGPWIPSPWDVVQWTDPGDDFSRLEIKKKAMKRYAETVIVKYPQNGS